MQMTRVSLGKTAKKNSRDMEGGLPDSSEGWLWSPLETKTSRRRIWFFYFNGCCFTFGALGTGKYYVLFFFFSWVVAKNSLEAPSSVSLHCSLGRKSCMSKCSFPTPNFRVSGLCFQDFFIEWTEVSEEVCKTGDALCITLIVPCK